MKPDRCSVTTAVSGPCQLCGRYQTREMHLCDDQALCGDCCPEHRVDHDWAAAEPVSGEQMDLSVLLEGD